MKHSSRGNIPRFAVPFIVSTISLLLVCFAFFSHSATAAIPSTMNFQGRLTDSTGTIMPDGLYNMQFRIYTVASGGSATWTETRETTNRVQVTNGLFSVQLGAVTPLSASLFSGNDVYFEITLPTPGTATCSTASCASWESPMTPRHKMATSAYAFQAENANTLDGMDSTAFAGVTGSANYIQNTTSPQTADFAITGTGRIDTTLQAPSIQRATAGSLSIGTTATTTGMTIGGTSLTGTLAITTGTSGTINIGSTANARTITIGDVAAVQTVTLGSTNTTSATTIQGGATGSISLATGGTINLNSGTIATNATTANFLNTTATTVNAFGAATTITMGANSGTANIRNSNVTVGNTTTRGTFTNNGATLNSTLTLGDLAAGAIGTAATTVNIYSGVTISPTVAGRTYTVPSPTTTTAGRTFYITNINATNSFIVLGQTIAPTTTATLVWGGAAWTISATPGAAGANTSLSNIASTNLGAALNTTSGNLTLQTTTSGNIILNPVGTVELQKSTNVTGNMAATGTVTGSNLSGTNSGDVGLAGQNYLTIAGQTITANAINLASSHVTGTLGLANGGTGATTAQGAINAISGLTTNGDLLYHNGTNSTRLARGTNGQCLTSNATTIQWGSCGLSAEADTLATVTGRGATTATATTFSGGLSATGSGTGLSVTNNATIGGTLGVTGAITGSSTIQGTRFISTVATGTAPLTVASTTKVTNLNVDQLDSLDSTAFGQIAANNSWTGTNTIGVTNAAAFRVQNAGGTAVITADTSSGAVLLGQASTSNGTLRFNNASNANTVSLVSGATSSSYTLTLPTAVGGAGQCLSDTSGTGVLGWTNCGNGSKKVTLTAEYPGAVLKADGTNNNGTMTSDFVSGLAGASGYKHTFYDWTTSQGAAQDYDIYVTHQLPNDINASTEFDAGSWKVWTYVDHVANSGITMTVYDNDGTACANGVSIKGGTTGWSQITLADFDTTASCDFTAGSIITIKINMSSITPSTNHVRVAGIEYSYTP